MYKQTFFAAMSILLSLPMITQQGYAAAANPNASLASTVERVAVQQLLNNHYVPWAKAIKKEEALVNKPGYMGYTAYGMFTTTYKQQPVPKAYKDVYKMRMGMLQNEIDNNAVLNGYTFVATVPEMLIDLQVQDFGYLFSFFQQSVDSREDLDPFLVPKFYKQEDGVIALEVSSMGAKTFILLVDVSKKRVYFFVDAIQK